QDQPAANGPATHNAAHRVPLARRLFCAYRRITHAYFLITCFRYFFQPAYPRHSNASNSEGDLQTTAGGEDLTKSGGNVRLCFAAERIGTKSSIAGRITMSAAFAISKMNFARSRLKPRMWKAQLLNSAEPSSPSAENSTPLPSGNSTR